MIRISDPWLGERVIKDGNANLIRDQLRLLLMFRDDGRIPSKHLLDNIKVYKFIMRQDDPEKYATEYLNKIIEMIENNTFMFIERKMVVAKALGWDVEND